MKKTNNVGEVKTMQNWVINNLLCILGSIIILFSLHGLSCFVSILDMARIWKIVVWGISGSVFLFGGAFIAYIVDTALNQK